MVQTKKYAEAAMICVVCSSRMRFMFRARVLGKWEASYDYCDSCGFLRVRQPHWLSEAYSTAVSALDTGVIARNISTARQLASVLYFGLNGRRGKRYLDVAAGYGLLTRLMRDYGFDFYWQDKYCENLFARGFEYRACVGPCDVVTAIEVLEHVENPVSFVAECLGATGADTLVFTTEVFEGEPAPPADWWYYACETGQHIAFFQRRTLIRLGEHLRMRYLNAGGLHVYTRRGLSGRLVRLLCGPLSHLTARVARRKLGCRTMADHEFLLGQQRASV
jgi:methyltransferase family protein